MARWICIDASIDLTPGVATTFARNAATSLGTGVWRCAEKGLLAFTDRNGIVHCVRSTAAALRPGVIVDGSVVLERQSYFYNGAPVFIGEGLYLFKAFTLGTRSGSRWVLHSSLSAPHSYTDENGDTAGDTWLQAAGSTDFHPEIETTKRTWTFEPAGADAQSQSNRTVAPWWPRWDLADTSAVAEGSAPICGVYEPQDGESGILTIGTKDGEALSMPPARTFLYAVEAPRWR